MDQDPEHCFKGLMARWGGGGGGGGGAKSRWVYKKSNGGV
jgi:hypothetical protein